MRLIDADALTKRIKTNLCEGCSNHRGLRCRACYVNDCVVLIDEEQNADPVTRARWREYDNGFYQCTNCRMIGANAPYRFCPDCGARMEDDE